MSKNTAKAPATRLRSRITCPNCWHVFRPEEILWISVHPELIGDLRDPSAQQRFLPTRFSIDGRAIDVRGQECSRLACPNCHLEVPRCFLELNPFFVSILGAPSSGKSYFLASMTWQLRKNMRAKLAVDFGDADPASNAILNGYEESLFLNPTPEKLVELQKTEMEGDLYQSVLFGEQLTWYAKPFIFTVRPLKERQRVGGANTTPRAFCLYDNAGEHFLPGADSTTHRGTQHLAHSEVLLFLFDPTQHPKFQKHCRGKSKDPQIQAEGHLQRQDLVLTEAESRIRNLTGLSSNQLHPRPLIVVVTKFDAWSCLTNISRLKEESVLRQMDGSVSALYLDGVQQISGVVRNLMQQLAPEVVAAAEGFCSEVIYIPVSALGTSPQKHTDPKLERLYVRPADIKPMWSEVPLLWAMNRAAPGIIPVARKTPSAEETSIEGYPKLKDTGS